MTNVSISFGPDGWARHSENRIPYGSTRGSTRPTTPTLDVGSWPGGVGLFGSLPSAAAIRREASPSGLHVHTRLMPAGPKVIDDFYDEIEVMNEHDRTSIDSEMAVAFSLGHLFSGALSDVRCSVCGTPHVDRGRAALSPHRYHKCRCGTVNITDTPVVGNPLVAIANRHLHEMVPATEVVDLDGCDSLEIMACTPAIIWSGPYPEEVGVHAHGFVENEQVVDGTFLAVKLPGGRRLDAVSASWAAARLALKRVEPTTR